MPKRTGRKIEKTNRSRVTKEWKKVNQNDSESRLYGKDFKKRTEEKLRRGRKAKRADGHVSIRNGSWWIKKITGWISLDLEARCG